MNAEWKPALDKFCNAATRFIEIVDSHANLTREQFLAHVEACLAELYGSALALPRVQPESEGIDGTRFNVWKWDALRKSLSEKIGDIDMYWTVFDATARDEPIVASLAGDLSEIYSDLKQSLEFVGRSPLHADVLWEVRFDFTSHWGRHLTAALKAIHDFHLTG